MAKDSSGLTDDELWAKCQQSGPITSNDLDLTSSQTPDGTGFLTEGTHYLQYELNNKNEDN